MSKKRSGLSGYFERRRARQRVYVVPTGAGVAMLALILALIFMSAVYASPSLQFLGFFLFALYTLSFAWTHSHLRKLDAVAFTLTPGFALEAGTIRLRARSGQRDERQGLEVKVHLRAEGRKAVTLSTEPFTLEETGAIERGFPFVLKAARGRWRVRRITIGTGAPFGLATAWISVPGAEDFFIYPRRMEVTLRPRALDAMEAAAPAPGEENFQALSESPWMTSALHVVPKPTADESSIIVKRFESDAGGGLLLDWTELPGGFEDRVSRCADALARWSPGTTLTLRTPVLNARVRDEQERRRALERFAEARA